MKLHLWRWKSNRAASAAAIWAVCAGILSPLSLAAAADEAGITVTGTGEAAARPNRVELDLSVAGSAELTGDALVEYTDAMRRATEAFDGLKLDNLTVEQRTVEFTRGAEGNSQQAMLMAAAGGGDGTAIKPEVGISRSLRVVLADIGELPEDELMETIGRLLDAAQDAGVSVGGSSNDSLLAQLNGMNTSPTSVATFVADNAEDTREQAYQRAFDAAKARAERLAALAGGTLGQVVSIEESAAEASEDDDEGLQVQMMKAIYGIGGGAAEQDGRLTSKKWGDIPIRVSLRVRFAMLQEKRATAARAE